MSVTEGLARAVRARAKGRCQYCLMHESLQGATFHIEHIIPLSKNGNSSLENLTLACPSCNLQKGNKTSAIDPATGQNAQLFHPNQQRWTEHFKFNGYRVEGLTVIGRGTVETLKLNHARRQCIREVERAFGLYPPLD